MSAKNGTYISLGFLLILGILYGYSAMKLPDLANQNTISDSYFPMLLSISLVVLCLISFIKTFLQKNDKKVDLSNLKMIVFTIIITALYILIWNLIGFFYLLTFFYILTLLAIYRWQLDHKKKVMIFNVIIALGTTVFVYYVFGQLMSVRL